MKQRDRNQKRECENLKRRRGTRAADPKDEGGTRGRDVRATGAGAPRLGASASEGEGTSKAIHRRSLPCKCCTPAFPWQWLPPFPCAGDEPETVLTGGAPRVFHKIIRTEEGSSGPSGEAHRWGLRNESFVLEMPNLKFYDPALLF